MERACDRAFEKLMTPYELRKHIVACHLAGEPVKREDFRSAVPSIPVDGCDFSAPEAFALLGRYDLATYLYIKRKDLGLRQSDVGELTGLSQGAVSNYESGRVEPQFPQIQRLTMALGPIRIENGIILAG